MGLGVPICAAGYDRKRIVGRKIVALKTFSSFKIGPWWDCYAEIN
jgi:hypothetical protein